MKITDVTLTLFAWDDIPATTYGAHTGAFQGESQLGLLRIATDQGLEGHAFLGSSMHSADQDGLSLIKNLKPLLLGQNPLERERLYDRLWHRNRRTTLRAIGAVDIALWDLAGKVANLPIHALLGSYRDRVPAYASSAVLRLARGLRRAGGRVQGQRLDRVQDPPADPARGRHPDLPGGPPGGRRRLPADAR